MRRRSFLGAIAASATLPGVVSAATPTRAPDRLSPSFVVDAPGLHEVVTGPDGRYAYGSAGDHLLVVDCDAVDSPTVVARAEATIAGEPMLGLGDVAIDGDRVVVAGPVSRVEGDPPSGAAVFDVSDPANPEQVAEVPIAYTTHNSGIAGDTVYLTGTSLGREPLIAYDVSGDEATERFRWSVVDQNGDWEGVTRSLYQVHDVVVRGDHAYVSYWDAGTWVLDVSDPNSPSPVVQIGGVDPGQYADLARESLFDELAQLPGNSHVAALSGDGSLLAIGREAGDRDATDDRYGGPGGVELYDVTDVANPEYRSALRAPVVEDSDGNPSVATAHNCSFRGDVLFTSWYSSGVRAYDLSDPTAPKDLGGWAAPDEASFWAAAPLDEGFVGASYVDPSASDEANRNSENAKLYTFPEPDESQAVDAATFQVNATGVPRNRPVYDFRANATATTTTTATATTTADSVTDRSTRTPTTGSTGGGVPGFGIAAAVAGTALGALHRIRDTE